MLGWFRPKCPLDPYAKEWVELRLAWLAEQFGMDVFVNRPVIEPTKHFFPDRYNSSEKSVHDLLGRVCRYIDANQNRVRIKFFSGDKNSPIVNDQGQALPGIAGLYEEQTLKTIIHLERQQLHYPMVLVGTMAHELAHHRLLGEMRIPGNIFDNELLTDLTAVFHGFGIFLANDPRSWESQYTKWPRTDAPKPEYMTLSMFGYALAHTAWFRGERKPLWAKHLRHGARASFKQSLKYLWNTGDSKFKPDHAQE